jgi:hypothetical protein
MRRLSADVPTVAQQQFRRRGALFLVRSVLHERLASLAEEESTYRRNLLVQLGVGAGVGPESDSPTISGLREFSTWATLLRGLADGDFETGPARALLKLANVTNAANKSLLEVVGRINSNPAHAIASLDGWARWVEGATVGLYVCRNLHLHSGVHDLDGGVTLGLLGPRMIDLLFEIWAVWYQAGSSVSPVNILERLGSRFDYCIATLRTHGRVEDLDPGRLTGPAWTPQTGTC